MGIPKILLTEKDLKLCFAEGNLFSWRINHFRGNKQRMTSFDQIASKKSQNASTPKSMIFPSKELKNWREKNSANTLFYHFSIQNNLEQFAQLSALIPWSFLRWT